MWDTTWKNFLKGQRKSARLAITSMFAELSQQLGLDTPHAGFAANMARDMSRAVDVGSDFRKFRD